MEQQSLLYFKELFLSLKRNLLSEMMMANDDLSGLGRGDTVDQVWEEKEKELSLKISGRKKFFIKKIDHALDKIDDGTFGVCEDCGQDIGEARLKARPTATMCIHCKEEAERGEGHILYHKKSHTLGRNLLSGSIS